MSIAVLGTDDSGIVPLDCSVQLLLYLCIDLNVVFTLHLLKIILQRCQPMVRWARRSNSSWDHLSTSAMTPYLLEPCQLDPPRAHL